LNCDDDDDDDDDDDVETQTRFERLQARKRVGDTTTLEEFQRIEQLELANPDPKGQQLGKVCCFDSCLFVKFGFVITNCAFFCIDLIYIVIIVVKVLKLADITIENNGSIEELNKAIESALKDVV
jgi:hypothetical protein